MSSINFHTKEVSVKIVYYGPGLCGKTTSLQKIYESLPADRRPESLVTLATEVDRTIFFDFLPVTAYKIRDFLVRLQLYTVPGQVFYNSTRKLVLNGVDGVVMVLDSQRAMADSNTESLQNLHENLLELGMEPSEVPMVMQFNKRDMADIHTIEEMDALYNSEQVPVFATTATRGEGLMEALRAVSKMVVNNLMQKGLGREGLRTATLQEQADASPIAAAIAETASTGGGGAAGAESRRPSRLWPTGEAAAKGAAIEQALIQGHWADVVGLVGELIDRQAQLWSEMSRRPGGTDARAEYLLLRGVSAQRYRTFVKSMQVIRDGGQVQQPEAMSAVVLALQALW